MKLCPQCAFIYEDVQTLCDMDGKELVPHSPPVVEPRPLPLRLEIAVLPKSTSRRFPIAAVACVVLVAVLAGLVVAQLIGRSRPSGTIAAQEVPPIVLPVMTSDPSTNVYSESVEQTLSDDLSSETAEADNSGAMESGQFRSALAAASRLRSISSGGSAGSSNQGPVLLRLVNGATIKADEAWRRKDGIWYRQGGVITFLKHSQVRSIERTKAAPSRSTEQRNQPTNVLAHNQSQTVKPQVVNVKKESRVSSFLKKTGRVLKKPFRF